MAENSTLLNTGGTTIVTTMSDSDVIGMVDSRSIVQSGLGTTTNYATANGTTLDDGHVEQDFILKIVTYVGASISLLGILLTLLSYIGYRKFQVKRTHIVTLNLSVCLLLYFVAYLLSNQHRHHALDELHRLDRHPLCLAGAFLSHISILGAWFWLSAYWALVLSMYRRPLGGHISHFFLKAALPAYGVAIACSVAAVAVAEARGEISVSYYSDLCFVDSGYLYFGLILPFAVTLLPVLAVFFVVLRGITWGKSRDQKRGNLRKVKVHFGKLTVISVLIGLMILSTILIPAVRDMGGSQNLASVVIFTVVSTALGVTLMFVFCIHQDEIRGHWVAVVTGKRTSVQQRSLRNKFGSFSGNRKNSVNQNRNPSFLVEAEEPRKNSRILPKDDADMTTLGLIQIPGTPSPARSDVTDLRVTRSDVINATAPSGEPKPATRRQKSVEQLFAKKARKGDAKRRSFSTNSFREGALAVAGKKKRESVASVDNVPVTDFL